MSNHAAPRHRVIWRTLKSTRVRAILSLGIVLGLGTTGTYAYWTDTSVLTTGSFAAGKMDLQFDTSGAVDLGTGYAKTSMTWSNLSPNERKAFNLTVKNVGNPPFTYGATGTRGTTPTWTYVGSPITVQLYLGTAVADTTYPQQDTCTGASLGTAQAIDATSKSLITTAQEIAANASQNICVVVGLDQAADNLNQGKTGSLSLTFTANQKTS